MLHAKNQNPRITPFGEKVCEAEERDTRKHNIIEAKFGVINVLLQCLTFNVCAFPTGNGSRGLG